jgi:hypothetical protein
VKYEIDRFFLLLASWANAIAFSFSPGFFSFFSFHGLAAAISLRRRGSNQLNSQGHKHNKSGAEDGW